MARKTDFTEMVDRHIGMKINELRVAMGLSRQQLAGQIGVTHQQLQKYEKGTNRISVGRLSLVAKVLREPMMYFIEGVHEASDKLPTHHQRMCIEVSRNFLKIKDSTHQNAINLLVRTLAGN